LEIGGKYRDFAPLKGTFCAKFNQLWMDGG
jgi:hypothetical protein